MGRFRPSFPRLGKHGPLKTVRLVGERRYGLITREDLRRLAISDRQATRLVQNGDLVRLHRAVFRLPGSPPSIQQQSLAACLAMGPRAVTSHLTAAALWGIVDPTEGLPEVTIPWANRSRQGSVIVHRSLLLDRSQVPEWVRFL